MWRRTTVLAFAIQSGLLLLSGCGTLSQAFVPQVVRTKPDSALLQKCEEPSLPDPSKSLDDNADALIDLAVKFRQCSDRHAGLVDYENRP